MPLGIQVTLHLVSGSCSLFEQLSLSEPHQLVEERRSAALSMRPLSTSLSSINTTDLLLQSFKKKFCENRAVVLTISPKI